MIGERSQLRFQGVDALDDRHQGLDFTVVLTAEDEIQDLCQHQALRGGYRYDGTLVHAVYRKHFLNPIGKTRVSDSSCLTLSCRVGYHRSQLPWSCAHYDASVDEAIACGTVGPLPVDGWRTRCGAIHLTRISPCASSQGHTWHRALHVDVCRRTGAGYGDRSRSGGACADFIHRAVFDLRMFVSFLISTRLPRSSGPSRRIADSDGASVPVRDS